jgi:hypothetical protein
MRCLELRPILSQACARKCKSGVDCRHNVLSAVADLVQKALRKLDSGHARNRHERAQIHLFRGFFYIGMGLRELADSQLQRQ